MRLDSDLFDLDRQTDGSTVLAVLRYCDTRTRQKTGHWASSFHSQKGFCLEAALVFISTNDVDPLSILGTRRGEAPEKVNFSTGKGAAEGTLPGDNF